MDLAKARKILPIDEPATEQDKFFRRLIAGAGAGILTKTATSPFERLKILYQIQHMHIRAASQTLSSSIPSGLAKLVREEGILGLWRGNGANVIRIIPNFALKFAMNDFFKDVFRARRDAADSTSDITTKEDVTQKILSGCGAGAVQIAATYPLDTVRTRLSMSASMLPNNVRYTGIVSCAKGIVTAEGVRGLYKGMAPTFAAGVPYVALQLSSYDILKSSAAVKVHIQNPVILTVACGAVAGIFANTLTFPGDVVRHRMQSNGIGGAPVVYKSSIDCIRTMLKKEGPRAFFSGLKVDIVRVIPSAAIQFLAYEYLTHMLRCPSGSH